MYMYAKHKGVMCIKTRQEMGKIGKFYIKVYENEKWGEHP